MRSECQGAEVIHDEEMIFFFILLCENLDRLGKYASTVWLVFAVTTVHVRLVLHLPDTSVSVVKSHLFFYPCQI